MHTNLQMYTNTRGSEVLAPPPRTEKTVWMEKRPADWSETFLRYTRVYLDPGSGQILVQYEHRVQSRKVKQVFWLQAINFQ